MFLMAFRRRGLQHPIYTPLQLRAFLCLRIRIRIIAYVKLYVSITSFPSASLTSTPATHILNLSSEYKASTAELIEPAAPVSLSSPTSTQMPMKTTTTSPASNSFACTTSSQVPTTFTIVTLTSLSTSAGPVKESPTSQEVLTSLEKRGGGA